MLITVGVEGFKPTMNRYTGVQFRNIYILILKTRQLTFTVIYVIMKRKKINCIFHVYLPDEFTLVGD